MAGRRSNGRLVATLCLVAAGMVGASFAAVPLYRVFCQITGFDGTPLTGQPAPGVVAGGGTVSVHFVANTQRDLPWRFEPGQREMRVHPGEEAAAFYVARNEGGRAIRGVSTYNVTPLKVAKYFHKTACFCFDEQTLEAGQETQFPLAFWVDPKLAEDPETRDVHNITLSYTFFHSLDDAAAQDALATAGPHVGRAAN